MVDLSQSMIPGDHPDCYCYTVFQGYKHYPNGEGDGIPGAGIPPYNGGEYSSPDSGDTLGGQWWIQYGEDLGGGAPIVDAFYVLTSTWIQTRSGYAKISDDEYYELPTLAGILRYFAIDGIPPAVIASWCDPCPALPILPDPNPIRPNPPDPLPPPFPDPFPPTFMDCCPEVLDLLRVLVVRINKVTEHVNEINDSLDTPKFAKDDNNSDIKRVANLGYYIERIARVLGVSVNSNGSIRSIRQKKEIVAGQNIPAGWNFGQWGLNTGANAEGQEGGEADHFKDGIVYEQRSNISDDVAKTIQGGNYTLCENIPQLLDEMLDDLDKALGWQELGGGVIPNADGSGKYFKYTGLAQLLTEIAFVTSRISQNATQTQVSSLISQAILQEVLRSTGQPLIPKSFRVDVGGDNLATVPYPGIAYDAPSQMQQTSWILQNLAPILAALVKAKDLEINTP